MEFKKKENKLKITGRAAAVEETKASAEVLRKTLVTVDYEVRRPGKYVRLFKYFYFMLTSLLYVLFAEHKPAFILLMVMGGVF